MELNYKKSGNGQPLIILHGLFGSLDNWQTLAKQFSERFTVYTVDQRNHGQSPHSREWNYQTMAGDLRELIVKEGIKKPVLIGHSMGGKTAMLFTIQYPDQVDKLIVVDIAPGYSPVEHRNVLDALASVDLNRVTSRKEVEDILSGYIRDTGTKQFLLKNLYWKDFENKKLAWRFNLDVVMENIEEIGMAMPEDEPVEDVPVLFIRGGRSEYIKEEDLGRIKKIFPMAEVKTIENAGHWVHAENPGDFYKTVMMFCI